MAEHQNALEELKARRAAQEASDDGAEVNSDAEEVVEEEPKKELAKKKHPNTKYDWEAIKNGFVHGIPQDGHDLPWFPTLKELAEYFQAPYGKVRNRSSKERWPTQKKRAQTDAAKKAYEDRLKKSGESLVEFDNNSYNFAKLGMAMATARMGEIAQELKASGDRRTLAQEKLSQGLPVEPHEMWSAIDAKELQTLAQAADVFQQIGRKALNADVIRHEISGPNGEAVSIEHSFDVVEELMRPDANRLNQLVSSLQEAGLTNILGEQIEDAEVIDEEGEENGDE